MGVVKIWHNCRGEKFSSRFAVPFPARTCDYGRASADWPHFTTPTRIIIIVRLFCFFYIRIAVVLLETARDSPPYFCSYLSERSFCPFFYYPLPRNALDILP